MKQLLIGVICAALVVAALLQIIRISSGPANRDFEADEIGVPTANPFGDSVQSVERSAEEFEQETYPETLDSPASSQVPTPVGRGRVVGQVIDADARAPIEHFSVQVFDVDQWHISNSPAIAMEFGNSLGQFSIQDIELLEVDLLIRAKGHTPTAVRGVSVGAYSDVGVVELSPARNLRGIVRNSVTGDPIPGASISVMGLSQQIFGTRRISLPGQSTKTSDDGTFELHELPNYEVRLNLTADGFGYTRHLLSVDARQNLQIMMAPAATVAGRIIDIDGSTPVAGSVRLAWNDGRGYRRGRTNDEGFFSMKNVEPGDYEIQATSRNGSSQPVKLNLAPSTYVDDLRLVIVLGSRLSGRVIGMQPGEELQSVTVENRDRSFSTALKPMPDGQYEFTNLQPGPYRISAMTDRRSISQEVIVNSDSETYMDLSFE